jgi:hypothetical protein
MMTDNKPFTVGRYWKEYDGSGQYLIPEDKELYTGTV